MSDLRTAPSVSAASLLALAIEARGVSKVFPGGTQALADVDLALAEGESLILLGGDGSGKSTLLKCLNRMIEPTSGEVRILGSDVTRARRRALRDVRREVGVVFHKINLVGELSVLTNVIHGSLGRARSPRGCFAATADSVRRDEAMQALGRVGLGPFAGRRADELSSGQQQRVAIARTLMQRPRIVLADEPVAALDPRSGCEVMDLLGEVTSEAGLTVVCTLHQLDLARRCGDRMLALRAGRVDMDTRMADVSDAQLEGLCTTEDDDD